MNLSKLSEDNKLISGVPTKDITSYKGWQIITKEQMINFISGMYKIDYLH